MYSSLKISLAALVFALFSSNAFACPDVSQNTDPQDTFEVQEYLRQLNYIPNGFKRNKMIEGCFLKKKEFISILQLETLFDGLYNVNSTDHFDNEETQNRMVQAYLDDGISRFSKEEIARLTSKFDNGFKRNLEIERFFNTTYRNMFLEDLEYLIEKLYDVNSTDRYDNEEVKDRMVRKFFDQVKNLVTSDFAVTLVKKLENGFERNKLIEEYYNLRKDVLSHEDVLHLLRNLYNMNTTDNYDNEEVQDRIGQDYFERSIDSMDLRLVIEIIKLQDNGFKRNMLIENYFQNIKLRIEFRDVEYLISKLYNANSTDRFDNEEVQDRIMTAWIDCQ